MTIDEEHQKFVEIFQRLLLEGCEEDEQDIEETAHRILDNPAHYPDYFPRQCDYRGRVYAM